MAKLTLHYDKRKKTTALYAGALPVILATQRQPSGVTRYDKIASLGIRPGDRFFVMRIEWDDGHRKECWSLEKLLNWFRCALLCRGCTYSPLAKGGPPPSNWDPKFCGRNGCADWFGLVGEFRVDERFSIRSRRYL